VVRPRTAACPAEVPEAGGADNRDVWPWHRGTTPR
jgi:hypothetical protein